MKEKGDSCILVGYSTQSNGNRVYNTRTRLIVESIHINSDEVKELLKTSDYDNSGPTPQLQKTSDHNISELGIHNHNNEPSSSTLISNVSPLANTTAPSLQELDLLFSPLYDEFFTAGNSSVLKSSPSNNSKQQDTHPTTNTQSTTTLITLTNTVTAKENNIDIQAEIQLEDEQIDENEFYNIFSTPIHEEAESSTRYVDSSNMHTFYQHHQSKHQWTKITLRTISLKSIQASANKMTTCNISGNVYVRAHQAEYVVLSESCAQVIWMRTQLKDYGFDYKKIPLYCDSQSAITISCNPVQHSRTKQINVRYHFIKEQVQRGVIKLSFVRTEYQLADMFTKALPKERFQYLVRRIGMRCLTLAKLEVLAKETA
nr:retrovirus-related Pol polyprotein from transposon TNT 1-94 [Tanacetum cinerariifolium]